MDLKRVMLGSKEGTVGSLKNGKDLRLMDLRLMDLRLVVLGLMDLRLMGGERQRRRALSK